MFMKQPLDVKLCKTSNSGKKKRGVAAPRPELRTCDYVILVYLSNNGIRFTKGFFQIKLCLKLYQNAPNFLQICNEAKNAKLKDKSLS